MKLQLLLSLALVATALGKTYDGYQVFQIQSATGEQVDQLNKLDLDLDFWSRSPIPGGFSDVMVSPEHVGRLTAALDSLRMDYSVKMSDVQKAIDEESQQAARQPRAVDLASFDYSVYHTADEISEWTSNFRLQYSDSASAMTVEEFQFKSYEDNEIKGLKFSTGAGHEGAFMQGGMHAREWIGPATVINMVKKFLDAYDSGDAVVLDFFSKFDLYVIPLLNVDGYQHTRPESPNADRLWRKNMQDIGHATCIGIDLNRNFGYNFGGEGADFDECSITYSGPQAYAATETRALHNWFLTETVNQRFRIFLDIHSYGQILFYPYASITSVDALVPDIDDVYFVADSATNATYAVNGEFYFPFQAGDYYISKGSSMDYGYAVVKAKYSYTLELRPSTFVSNGFVLSADQIQATAEEAFAGVMEIFRLASQEIVA